MILFSVLPDICKGTLLQLATDRRVEDLLIDSRKILVSGQAVFFAIAGDRHNGHDYLLPLYKVGIRQFVVERAVDITSLPEANVMKVASSVAALQALAHFHRTNFQIPVIALTGSNGKTIIKEWLYQLLSPSYRVVKNPGSYNSQLGVPLSVWQMQGQHQVAIFEAGVSSTGEMQRLEHVIQPTLGIFTNIGTAHDEGFVSIVEKIKEKLLLFSHVEKLVYCRDHADIHEQVVAAHIPSVSWGTHSEAYYQIQQEEKQINIKSATHSFHLKLPFFDKASVENAMHAVVMLFELNIPLKEIQERILGLRAVPMRLELKQGINDCQLIDDAYNNDVGGLQISLDFLGSLQKKKKTLILSDILQSGLADKELVARMAELINSSGVNRLLAIGPVLFAHQALLKKNIPTVSFYEDTQTAIEEINWNEFQHEIILIKGARKFQFEKIVSRLQLKIHGTRMEIDLDKVVHNLNYFKSILHPGVKIMVMVKAFAYGSGSEAVANLLQYHRVDYLGVAYADEGVELRKNQITLPIMVMNPTEESFENIFLHHLEPVLYNLAMLRAWINFLQGRAGTIHLEVETGMKRLGLEEGDLDKVIALLAANPHITVASIYSHLAAADEAQHDDFSKEQIAIYQKFYEKMSSALAITPVRHIVNSPGILRFPQYQFDMVRLGIGLYGVNPTSEPYSELQPVATLKTVISQIKKIKAGESIGYGRKGEAEHNMTLATIAIGYADGFSRSFSRGVGHVLVRNKRVPVVGNVCMDMTMIDVTGTEAQEGDDVIVFGEQLPIQEVAASIHTIPYEILTNTSERVKRVFFAESI